MAINCSSETAMNTLAALQSSFMHKGFTLGQGKVLALNMLQGMVTKQAAIAAFKDVFLVTAVLCAIGILPALFIQDGKKPKQEPCKESVQDNERAEAVSHAS